MTRNRDADHETVMTLVTPDWETARLPRPAPKPTKQKKPARKILEQQLEDICKLIVFWRDGCECVERHIDGARCGGGVQWGHYIPRQQSRWLKYEIGNTYAQCRNHNNLHDKGAQTMSAWFASTIGATAARMLEEERAAHRGEKNQTIDELREMLKRYDELYQNRYFVTPELKDLIAAGYYGKTIRDAWKIDGRI